MEDVFTLDLEYKRYLQILRPYLGQLTNENVINICNAWIQRLSECTEAEKVMRNKYVFSMCYQLAKGVLEDPFLSAPPLNILVPIPESINSDDSSTEIECAVVNCDDSHTEVIFNRKTPLESGTEIISQEKEYSKAESVSDNDNSFAKSGRSRKQTVLCYACPTISNFNSNCEDLFGYKAKNLIKKLRDMKNENCMLQCELLSLKGENQIKNETIDEHDKIDSVTKALQRKESNATIKSLKCRLHEVQEARNALIEKLSTLQEQLDNYDSVKAHEIEEIEAKHKLEVIEIKTLVKDEVKDVYDKKIETIKTNFELKIKEIEDNSSSHIKETMLSREKDLEAIQNTISAKNSEIERLRVQIDDLKKHLHSVLEKYIDKPIECCSEETSRFKTQQLEKRLVKLEKNKIKSTRIYEARIAQLQREKHMAECTLQLQMVKQRAHVVNEVTDENQAELTTALDKLEGKYKEIVANVQATAIQRRVQDQRAIESILQAACALPQENTQPNRQFPKTMRHNQIYDNEISPLLHCNNGNKSFGEDSLTGGYCLSGERMGELFERLYIPQRDNSEGPK